MERMMNNRLKNKRLFFFMLIIFSTVGCQNTPINDADGLPPSTPTKNATLEKSQPSENGWVSHFQTATSDKSTQRLLLPTPTKNLTVEKSQPSENGWVSNSQTATSDKSTQQLLSPTLIKNVTLEKSQPSEKWWWFGETTEAATSENPTQRTCWDTSGDGRVFILAVGSNTHGLTETNRDAARFAKAMRELFDVHHNRVCVLKDAYKEEFVHALKRLGDSRRVGADDLVIIFYSGHGARSNDDNDDEKLDRLDEFFGTIAPKPRTRYLLRDDDFSALIQNIPTPNILTFIDACFSGGLDKGDNSKKPIKNERIKFDATTFDDATIPNSGRTHVGTTLDAVKGVLLAASMENQPAVELPRRGGRFTVFFLDALKQAKQKRQLVDLLTVFEKTRNNVYQHSRQHSEKVQVPVKKGSDELFRRINDYIP
jgi:hypothetical protein